MSEHPMSTALAKVGIIPADYWREGAILLARTERGNRLHAGVLHPIDDRMATMTPLCSSRKRDGSRLAAHLAVRYPMLTGFTALSFREALDSPAHQALLCRHCIAVYRLPETIDPLNP